MVTVKEENEECSMICALCHTSLRQVLIFFYQC